MKQSYAAAAARVARKIVEVASRRVEFASSFPTAPPGDPRRAQHLSFYLADPDAFYRRLGTDAKMAFGEAYVAGDWRPGDGTDLADLLTPFAARLTELVPAPLRRMRAVIDRRIPRHTANTRDGATSNIALTTTCRTTSSRPSSTRP